MTEERLSAQTPPPTKPSSLVTSEIEIIRSCEERFITTDHSLSLGDQVASSELNTDLVVKSDGALSPSEKPEYLMPKSLSEALTKEMKEATTVRRDSSERLMVSDRPSVSSAKSDVDASGASTSSGEQLKSTESDISTQDKSTEDRSMDSVPSGKKSSLRRVQDMETSQEFTTADFYIEDSMPSSIADSPTGKVPAQEAESDKTVLDEKSTQVNTLEKDIDFYKQEFHIAQQRHKQIVEHLQSNIPVFRSNLKDFESDFGCKKSEIFQWIEDAKQRVTETMLAYDSYITAQREESATKMKMEHESAFSELSKRLESSNSVNEQLEQSISNLKEELQNVKDEQKVERERYVSVETEMKTDKQNLLDKLENLKLENQITEETMIKEIEQLKQQKLELEARYSEERDDWNKNKEELGAKYKEEIDDLTKSNELELEVELDKLRAELKTQFDEMELEISEKEKAIMLANDKIKHLEIEKIKIEENLTERYQKEKEEISKILEEELQKKMDIVTTEKLNALFEEHQSVVEKLKESHRCEMEEKIDNLRKEMEEEKDIHVDSVVKQLNNEYEKSYKELKNSLSEEKENSITELNNIHQKELSNLNAEIGKLKADLKALTEKDVTETDVQTDVVELIHEEMQTDRLTQEQQEVQTDVPNIVQTEMQTDKLETKQSEIQTEKQETMQSEMQTEKVYTVQTDMQTDVWTGEDNVTQTEACVVSHGETQTSTSEYTLVRVMSDSGDGQDQESQTSLVEEREITLSQLEHKAAQTSEEGGQEATMSRQEHKNMMATLEVRLTAEKDKVGIVCVDGSRVGSRY